MNALQHLQRIIDRALTAPAKGTVREAAQEHVDLMESARSVEGVLMQMEAMKQQAAARKPEAPAEPKP